MGELATLTLSIPDTTPQPTTAATTSKEAPTSTTPTVDTELQALAELLEKQLAKNPAAAKLTATRLVEKYPARFTAAWLLALFQHVDAAQRKKQLMETAQGTWDTEPTTAKAAAAALARLAPIDPRLVRWAKGFIAKVDNYQDNWTLAHQWDRRPSDAAAAAQRMHDRSPQQYSKSWLAAKKQQIQAHQDVMWADRVNPEEVRAWLGDNQIDLGEAPPQVIDALRIQLGRAKAEQYFGKSGKGVRDTALLNLPTTDAKTKILDKVQKADPTKQFQFTKQADIPVKRLEVQANQLSKEATDLRRETDSCSLGGGSRLLAPYPDVMVQLFARGAEQRARDLDKASDAYRTLATRIRNGETTIAAERGLLARDRAALEYALGKQRDVLTQVAGTDDAARVQKTIETLQRSYDQLDKVLADPQGIAPGGGFWLQFLPEPKENAFTTSPQEVSDAKWLMDGVDRITGTTDAPYGESNGKTFNRQMVWALHQLGALGGMQAGMYRLLGDAGTHLYLPAFITDRLRTTAEVMSKSSAALQRAESAVTSLDRDSMEKADATGRKLPLLDRLTQTFADRPLDSVSDVLSALSVPFPELAPLALVVNVAVGQFHAVESFLTTYGQTGDLGESLKAGGMAELQAIVGLGLGALHLPIALDGVANLTLTYAMCKAQGMSSDQIEVEMVHAMILLSITAGGHGELTNMKEKSAALTTALETRKAPELPGTPKDPASSAKVDRVATELADAEVKSEQTIKELRIAEEGKQPTQKILAALAETTRLSQAKERELDALYGVDRTKLKPTKPTKPEPNTVPKTEPKTETKPDTRQVVPIFGLWKAENLTAETYAVVEAHLGKMAPAERNVLALERLRKIMAGEIRGTETDRRFFEHEKLEAQLETEGWKYPESHLEAIRRLGFGEHPFDLYGVGNYQRGDENRFKWKPLTNKDDKSYAQVEGMGVGVGKDFRITEFPYLRKGGALEKKDLAEQRYDELMDRTPTGGEDRMSVELTRAAYQRRANEARQKYGPMVEKLDDYELRAVIGYTSSDGMDINKAQLGQLTPGKTQDALLYGELVQRGLAKLPDHAETVNRAVTYSPAVIAQYAKGAVVFHENFLSTTRKSLDALAKDNSIGGNVELILHVKTGKDISMLSIKNSEDELLIPSGVAFHVDDVRTTGGRTVIELTEVPPTKTMVPIRPVD